MRDYLVVRAVDYADEVGQVGFSDVVKGQQYFLPASGSYDPFEFQQKTPEQPLVMTRTNKPCREQ